MLPGDGRATATALVTHFTSLREEQGMARNYRRRPYGSKYKPKTHTIVLNSGAVLSVNAKGRCEDAPCCGCCT
ncbi:hypothetical protein PBI_TINAFEYGE_75 [Mycobacterium phage TinaFeyge]|uniref:Uncharacterized protein n=69 Tax=Backyardiganvirus TaxID=2946815 RepID=A0A1L5C1H1_9CAUD|nr:hypothetical protein SEA_IRACEMA64_77 [Mycobacterium phage Iracema64]YP_010062552.1 hypothetical protein KIY69_gp79 [Mycobacterium phage Cerulean]AIY32238.1 hypothetical protein PBI_HAMSLICE_73 [Mycobacterium phage HamSlice]ALF01134.1 hypothetical protein SEA_MAVERICK_76 [Mycobacterium phage Maverick]AOQ27624.1 hypothetical protein SEA_FLOREAN_77 [Mycobacterium phage Florean]AOT27854.1 hypothetical protein SEA_ROOSEVELT_75 [Mycobacterium phage Roosevelt]APD17337.1 hypothetical protein PBI_